MNNKLTVISDKRLGSAQFVFVHKLTLIILEALYYFATRCMITKEITFICALCVCVCELSEIIALHYEVCWPFNRRLGGVNPRRELLRVGKGLLGLRSPVARGNWSGHMR